MKRVSPEHGNIRVRAVGRGIPYLTEPGWYTIPAWSRGSKPFDQLSPFKIGHEPGKNFECYWQSWKVWSKVEKQEKFDWSWPEETHVDQDTGLPNEKWIKWHEALLNNKRPVRRPNGRAIPLYAWWEGEQLDVVQARKRIYIPELQKLYRAHPVYQILLDRVRSGHNLIIVEPDGPCYKTWPKGRDVDLQLLVDLQDRTTREEDPTKYFPYGHGYVLALTILQDLTK